MQVGVKTGGWKLPMIGVALCLATPLAPAADAAPDPSLRVSQTLAVTSESGVSDTERALLRLEARASQTRGDEAAIIHDMMVRLERMAVTVTDLQKLIMAIPDRPCTPAKVTCPAVPAAPAAGAGELPWLPLAGGAAVLALLGLLWRQRRGKAAAASDQPFSMTVTEMPAPAAVPAAAPAAAPEAAPQPAAEGAKPAEKEATDVAAIPAPSPAPTVESLQAEIGLTPAPATTDETTADADLSLELADVMLSMGLTDGAAQALAEHIRVHPRQALLHWLKLLEIYRRSDMKSEFEKAAHELQQHFNVAPPEWQAEGTSAAQIDGIEHYAHIVTRVQELWPRRSCAEYLQRLLEDNRGGTRAGFPPPVIEDILLLLAILKD